MEFFKYVLIALLIVQLFYNRLSVVIGLFIWTVVWIPIAFVINLVVSDPVGYFGFWVALWDWEASTWADLIHANIGGGIASLMTLVLTKKKVQMALQSAASEVAEGDQQK